MPKNFSTSGLIHHLKTRHPIQYAEYIKTTMLKRTPTSTPTPLVAAVFEKAKKFANDSAKARGITEKMMEFIALELNIIWVIGKKNLLHLIVTELNEYI